MTNEPRFNYIITIHNKENLIEEVLKCVLMCCRDNSHVYPVLDGCTDNTEKIVDAIINKFSGVPITKVYTPDVHELLSINAGLQAASQEGEGFNIILQDDVLLADFMLENKIRQVYEWAGPDLGYVSFRMGANFKSDAYKSDEHIPLTDFIENACGNGLPDSEMLPLGCLAYRTIPIKSPVCIPFKIVREVGMLEDKLAPYAHDDTDYSIRLVKAGYRNAVFALKFFSDIKWGGTRVSPHTKIGEIQKRNMNFIRKLHQNDLMNICGNQKKENIMVINGLTDEFTKRESIVIWENNRRELDAYYHSKKYNKLKSFIPKPIKQSILSLRKLFTNEKR